MSLDVSIIDATRGLRVSFTAASGSVTAILGPNGAGKSTILDAIAGVHPCGGSISLGGKVLSGLPAHRRGVALLDQDASLFPHLTVLDNVAFAPRCRGQSRRSAREAARQWLVTVGADQFADRKPSQLSGGQAQRVAIARALAAEPRLILLDEPMAALDAAAVPEVRAVLRKVLRNDQRTALLVTHDPLDALTLADRVIVVDKGGIVEAGLTHDVLTRPRSAFAAQLAGLNLIEGTFLADGRLQTLAGTVSGQAADALRPGDAAVAVCLPSAVSVFLEVPHGSPRNHFAVRINSVEPFGAGMRVRAGDLMADISLASAAELALHPGNVVHFVVKAAETQIYALLSESGSG